MECYASPWKLVGLLLLNVVLVGACAFCTWAPETTARVVGWFGLAFFSLGFVAVPKMLLKEGPIVVVDERGIEDRRWKNVRIGWDEMASLRVVSISGQRMLGIDLVDPDAWFEKAPASFRFGRKFGQAMGLPDVCVSFQGLKPGLDAVFAQIMAQSEPAGYPIPVDGDEDGGV